MSIDGTNESIENISSENTKIMKNDSSLEDHSDGSVCIESPDKENDSVKDLSDEDVKADPPKEEVEPQTELESQENVKVEKAEDIPVNQEFDEILSSIRGTDEESEIESVFSLRDFMYSGKSFETDMDSYTRCKESLDKYAYLFITNIEDLVSKYFVDRLLQSIDTYGNLSRKELVFQNHMDDENKIDFLDVENYLSSCVQEHLLVLDLCKFGHIEKEYFLNSLYRYMQKDGNKVKFREMLTRNRIKLMIVAYEEDIEDKNDILNIYQVDLECDDIETSHDESDIQTYLLERSGNRVEKDLLLIASIFKGVSPQEIQELLSIVLEDEDFSNWKNKRTYFLRQTHLRSEVHEGSGTVIEFDDTLKGREDHVMLWLQKEDPFFISEFFEAFEKHNILFNATLNGKKSIAFTNGFFTLVEKIVLDDPDKLSLSWFGNKFTQNISKYSINYFFSLASCALQVSSTLPDPNFLDRMCLYFYDKKEFNALFYLVEYFSTIDSFDTFKWYKVILSNLDFSRENRTLHIQMYRSIQKIIYEEPCRLNTILSWTGHHKQKLLNEHSFYILLRLTSDSVNSNKDWKLKNNSTLPFLFDLSDKDKFFDCIESYIKYIYSLKDIKDEMDMTFYQHTLAENVNKLFFTKIMALPLNYVSKRDYEVVLKSVTKDIFKLTRDKNNYQLFGMTPKN